MPDLELKHQPRSLCEYFSQWDEYEGTAAGPVASLDRPVNDDSGVHSMSDLVADVRRPSPDEAAAARSLSADLERALASLTERQADILRRRYGLHGLRRESLPELGQRYRLTAERIRQIEHEALV